MSNDNELPAGFGDPSGTSQRYENWKFKNIKDGEVDEHIFRVLPAMKSLLQIDDIGLYWAIHYGWNGVNAKDPSKKAYHPFLCIQEKDYGRIVVECPACTYRNGFLDKLKAAVPKSELANKLEAWKKAHGLDGKFRIPCIDKQGRFGIFHAPYNFVKSLKEEMRQLRLQDYPASGDFTNKYPGAVGPIKPAGRTGVWFKFVRTGKASPTSDKAVVNRIVNPDGSEMKDFHRITDEQLAEASNRIPDLVSLKEQNRISVDKIEALVALDKLGKGSPDPVEVDRILDAGKQQEEHVDEEVDFTGSVASGASVAPPAEPAKAPAEAPKAAETKAAPVEAPKAEVKADPTPPAAPTETYDDLWG
jgi:hypothetical protein